MTLFLFFVETRSIALIVLVFFLFLGGRGMGRKRRGPDVIPLSQPQLRSDLSRVLSGSQGVFLLFSSLFVAVSCAL